jgi:hypothetical protein
MKRREGIDLNFSYYPSKELYLKKNSPLMQINHLTAIYSYGRVEAFILQRLAIAAKRTLNVFQAVQGYIQPNWNTEQ